MLSKKHLSLCVLLLYAAPAFANAASVQIINVSPTGLIAPGSTVNFIISPNGFINPSYTQSDILNAAGSTVGTIDQVGYYSWTPTIYDAGLHAITITATDAYQHAASSTVSILVASTVVLVKNLNPGPIVSVAKPVSFTLVAPGFISPKYTVNDTAWRSSITPANVDSSGNFTWTPNSDDMGTHVLTISATDPYGHHAEAALSITVVQPVLTLQGLTAGTAAGVGTAVSLRASAVMLATTTTYSVTDSFTGTSTISASSISPTGTLHWVPAVSDIGQHTLTVTATDSYGNTASTTAMIRVAATPAASATPVAVTSTSAAVTPTAAPSATTQPSAASYAFTKNISIGSGGAAVTALQNRLKTLGYYTGPVTGYFGPLTAVGVRKFQKANGLSQVGFVGPGTRAVLNK